MSDIDTNILEKIDLSGKFAIQVDDSTDISGNAQLLVNVCFLDKDVIKEYLFFCKRLPKNCLLLLSFKLLNKRNLNGKVG